MLRRAASIPGGAVALAAALAGDGLLTAWQLDAICEGRQAQLRARLPHLNIDTLRGNVNTRLRKLDEGQYDAILLAAAGLKRLGFENRITAVLEPEESLPAVGQGALGIEIRSGNPELAALLASKQNFKVTINGGGGRSFTVEVSKYVKL